MNRSRVHLVLGVFLLAPLATAGDHWVDPVLGDDANSGSTPGDAWRTMTHAMTALGPPVPGGSVENLILRPGTYSMSTGEVFPVRLRRALNVIGEEGANATSIVGEAHASVFEISNPGQVVPEGIAMRGMTVRGGAVGIYIETAFVTINLSLDEVSLRENTTGLRHAANGGTGFLDLHARRLLVRESWNGMYLDGACHVVLEEGTFRMNETVGLHLRSSAYMTVDARRCRFVNTGIGIRADGVTSGMTVNVEDSLFTHNLVGVYRSGFPGIHLELNRSTITDNQYGVQVGDQSPHLLLVEDGILVGNGEDAYGNINAIDTRSSWTMGDPMFVDPGTRDYRLAYGSPCVDRRPPLAGTLDQQGRPRDADGDGNLLRASDLGALELVPLAFDGSVTLGETAELELFGEAGGRSLVLFARGHPVVVPFTNQYGELFLAPDGLRILGLFAHQPGTGPTAVPFSVPDQPAFLGQTFTFQAISSSSAAPAGGAYTTTATFTIE